MFKRSQWQISLTYKLFCSLLRILFMSSSLLKFSSPICCKICTTPPANAWLQSWSTNLSSFITLKFHSSFLCFNVSWANSTNFAQRALIKCCLPPQWKKKAGGFHSWFDLAWNQPNRSNPSRVLWIWANLGLDDENIFPFYTRKEAAGTSRLRTTSLMVHVIL